MSLIEFCLMNSLQGLYDISYLWYAFVGIIVSMGTGMLVSGIMNATGNNYKAMYFVYKCKYEDCTQVHSCLPIIYLKSCLLFTIGLSNRSGSQGLEETKGMGKAMSEHQVQS